MKYLELSQYNLKQYLEGIPKEVVPLLPNIDIIVDTNEIKVNLCRGGDFEEIEEVVTALSKLIEYLKPEGVNTKGRFLLRMSGVLTGMPSGTEREFNLIRKSDGANIAMGDILYLKDNPLMLFLVTEIEFFSKDDFNLTLQYIDDEGAYCPKEYLDGGAQFIKV
jgi:hypothetical protein